MSDVIDGAFRQDWQDLLRMAVAFGNPVVATGYGVGPTGEAARIGGARVVGLEEQLESGKRIPVLRIKTSGSVMDRLFARGLVQPRQNRAACRVLADFYLARGGQRLGVNFEAMPGSGSGEDMSARRLDAKVRLERLHDLLTPDRANPVAWALLERIVVDGEGLTEAGALFADRWKCAKQTTAATSLLLGETLDRVAEFYGLT
jgi:hypothetical protein